MMYICRHSAYEYQMDLFFINDLKDQKFRVGTLMIDMFDKFMHVVAIQGKKEEDLASGMIECLNKMGKKPKIFFYRRRGSNEQGGNTKVFAGTEHRTSQD